jgi:hypothetical protein
MAVNDYFNLGKATIVALLYGYATDYDYNYDYDYDYCVNLLTLKLVSK